MHGLRTLTALDVLPRALHGRTDPPPTSSPMLAPTPLAEMSPPEAVDLCCVCRQLEHGDVIAYVSGGGACERLARACSCRVASATFMPLSVLLQAGRELCELPWQRRAGTATAAQGGPEFGHHAPGARREFCGSRGRCRRKATELVKQADATELCCFAVDLRQRRAVLRSVPLTRVSFLHSVVLTRRLCSRHRAEGVPSHELVHGLAQLVCERACWVVLGRRRAARCPGRGRTFFSPFSRAERAAAGQNRRTWSCSRDRARTATKENPAPPALGRAGVSTRATRPENASLSTIRCGQLTSPTLKIKIEKPRV